MSTLLHVVNYGYSANRYILPSLVRLNQRLLTLVFDASLLLLSTILWCKSEDNLIVTNKFISCYNIKILYRLWEKYMIFSLNFA